MKFVLEIDLGNDAPTKYIDVAYMLRETDLSIRAWALISGANTGSIKDYNGNNVGTWRFTDE